MADRNTEIANIYGEIFKRNSSQDKYDEIVRQARIIFIERNSLYGDAFKETGVFGTFAVLAGDVARLRKMIFSRNDISDKETREIQDKLLDVINQAVITIMMFEQNNWIGETQE